MIGHNQVDGNISYAPVMLSVASPLPSFSPPQFSMNQPPSNFSMNQPSSHFSMNQPPLFSPPYLSMSQSSAYSATPSAHYSPWCPSPSAYSTFVLSFIKGNISDYIGCQIKPESHPMTCALNIKNGGNSPLKDQTLRSRSLAMFTITVNQTVCGYGAHILILYS